jgi:nucleoside-diphosphate-sugar epimerase
VVEPQSVVAVKALVTGGSGVVGRALVATLLDRGNDVAVYDLRPPLDARALFFPGDVLDDRALLEASRGCDVVFHLAARLPQAKLSPAAIQEINVGGTRRVADACVTNDVRRLVFASTIEVYGPQRSDVALDEDAPKLFTGAYSRTKWAAEQLLASYEGLESVCLRMPMVLGPGFYHERSIISLFHAMRRGRPIPVPARDVPYSAVAATDAAEAFVLAAERPGAARHVLNVAAGDSPSWAEFVRDAIERVGSRSRPLRIPTAITRAAIACAKGASRVSGGRFPATPRELMDFALVGGAYSIERARRVLGYAPAISCAEAWAITYRWYFEQRHRVQPRRRRRG